MARGSLFAVAMAVLMGGLVAGCGDEPRVEVLLEPVVDVESPVDREPELVPDVATTDEADAAVVSSEEDLWVLGRVPEGMRLSEVTKRYSADRDSDSGSSTVSYSGVGTFLIVSNATGAAAAELFAVFSDVPDDEELVVTDVTVGGQAGLLIVGNSLLPDSGPYLATTIMWPVGADPMRSVSAYGEFTEDEVLEMAETLVPRPPEVPYKIAVHAQADDLGRVELSSLFWGPGGSDEICFNWTHGTGSGHGCFSPTTTEILVRQNILVAGVALNGEREVVLRIGDEEFTVATYPTVDINVRMFLAITAAPDSAELS